MARAGRKRKIGKREPNGRLQRPKDFRDLEKEKVMAPMIDARARIYKLPADQARDTRAETVIGRWYLREEISNQQWQASDQYLKDVRAYAQAVQSPKGAQSALSGGVGGQDGDETDQERRRSLNALKRYHDLLEVILAAEMHHQGVSDALAAVVLRDYDLPDVIGLVRLGLNALARYYRIPVDEPKVG